VVGHGCPHALGSGGAAREILPYVYYIVLNRGFQFLNTAEFLLAAQAVIKFDLDASARDIPLKIKKMGLHHRTLVRQGRRKTDVDGAQQ